MQNSIMVIDVEPFLKGSQADKEAVARQFDEACTNIGFIVITGHGIDPDLPEQVFERARSFFDLTMEEKRLVRKEDGANGAGYHPFMTQANAATLGVDTPEDLRESFGMGRPDRRMGSFNRWPAHPADLQEACMAYYMQLERLGFSLTHIFAMALGLPETYFDDKVERHDSALLLHHYPQQKTPPLPDQIRSGVHTDIGLFTMLRTERQHRPGGLQCMNRDGQWVDVPAIDNSFIMNIGDVMMRWTNDRWISNKHRVINPPLGSGEESRRISMPFFFTANDDAVIECLPGCFSDENPRKYEPANAGELRRYKLERTYNYAKRKAEKQLA